MGFFIWLTVILCALSAALFIRVTYFGKPLGQLLTKAVASAFFVLLGILCACARPLGEGLAFYAPLMLIGLCLGFVGDVSLAYQDVKPQWKDRSFLVGLSSFLGGHIFYIILFMCLGRTTWLQWLLAVVIFAALYLLQFPAKVELGSMKLPVIVYAAVISLMLAYAIGLAVYEPGLRSGMILCGGVLFCVSDAILALLYFGRPNNRGTLRAFNLGTYYLAQLLLALSIWLR